MVTTNWFIQIYIGLALLWLPSTLTNLYYYRDLSPSFRPFLIPDDQVNLWFEVKPLLKLKSIPIKSFDLDIDTLLSSLAIPIDRAILLFTPNKIYLLNDSLSSNVLKINTFLPSKSLGIDLKQSSLPVSLSEKSFLISPISQSKVSSRSSSLSTANLIEQYEIASNYYRSDQPVKPFLLKYAIKLTSDHPSCRIISQAFDKQHIFLLIEITIDSKSIYLIGRLCFAGHINSLIALTFPDRHLSPTSISIANLTSTDFVLLIGYSNINSGLIELFDLNDLNKELDRAGEICAKGTISSVYTLNDILLNRNESSCKLRQQPFTRCGQLNEKSPIVGVKNRFSSLIKKKSKLDGLVLNSLAISTVWPFPHLIIIILTTSTVNKCGLTRDWTFYCSVISTIPFGQPKPILSFIHATGRINLQLDGGKGQVQSYQLNLFTCSCFTDCFSCQAYGYHWDCSWSANECHETRSIRSTSQQINSCFIIEKVYKTNNSSSKSSNEITILLNSNITSISSNWKPSVLVENSDCLIKTISSNEIICNVINPLPGSVQLEVTIEPATELGPYRSLSIVNETTLIEGGSQDKLIIPLGMFDGPGKNGLLFIMLGIIMTFGITISYFVQKIAN